MHGLIIREPWIGYILSGAKTWEMRTTPTLRRERIGLIRKGTGLVIGVAAATTSASEIATAGVAGVAAGAVSMALGEYVSVSSQRDSERALIAKERGELRAMPVAEQAELVAGQALQELTVGEGVSVAEATRWCAGAVTARDVTRLRRLAGDPAQTTA